MGDGGWEMGDGRWEMGDGRWEMGDGGWEMGDPSFQGQRPATTIAWGASPRIRINNISRALKARPLHGAPASCRRNGLNLERRKGGKQQRRKAAKLDKNLRPSTPLKLRKVQTFDLRLRPAPEAPATTIPAYSLYAPPRHLPRPIHRHARSPRARLLPIPGRRRPHGGRKRECPPARGEHRFPDLRRCGRTHPDPGVYSETEPPRNPHDPQHRRSSLSAVPGYRLRPLWHGLANPSLTHSCPQPLPVGAVASSWKYPRTITIGWQHCARGSPQVKAHMAVEECYRVPAVVSSLHWWVKGRSNSSVVDRYGTRIQKILMNVHPCRNLRPAKVHCLIDSQYQRKRSDWSGELHEVGSDKSIHSIGSVS